MVRRSLSIRAANIAVAALALVVLSPLLMLIAVLIKLDSRGPILYRQLRVGQDLRARDPRGQNRDRREMDLGGRPFTIYKFRTMRAGAEHRTGPIWAAIDDDRVTRLGAWLRRTRLDELPQFWNVLRGDMAVVGPRPERPSIFGRLREELSEYSVRQRVPPGITGWAQVHHPPDQSVDDVREKLRYDLEYVSQRSLKFDLRIMLRTLPIMLLPGRNSRPR